MLLREPRAWTIRQLRRRLGYPAMSLATLARRVREQASWRRPRLVAKGDPDEAAVLAALHQEIEALPEGAAILAEDESHVDTVLSIQVRGSTARSVGWSSARMTGMQPPRMSAHARRWASTSFADHSPA
jgi:hypothetical protein